MRPLRRERVTGSDDGGKRSSRLGRDVKGAGCGTVAVYVRAKNIADTIYGGTANDKTGARTVYAEMKLRPRPVN